MPTIFDLPQLLSKFSSKEKKQFDSLFSYYQSTVPLAFNAKKTKQYVAKRFATKSLTKREVIAVSSLIFGQETIFNPLRSQRPITTQQKQSVDNMANMNCDFCDAVDKTPYDSFGRLESKYCVTAANAGSFDGLHSLVIPKDIHNVFHITEDIFIDMLELAFQWITTAHQHYPHTIFPIIFWNSSPKAGASLVHPHLQIILRIQPFLRLNTLHEQIQIYKEKYKQPFFPSFFSSLTTLGLTMQDKTTTIAASLTPVKEKEMLIWDSTNKLSTKNLWEVVTWWKATNQMNFNMAITLPPLDSTWKDFPIFTRFVNRGEEEIMTSDIASMELFFASVVSSDPFKVIEEFKKTLV